MTQLVEALSAERHDRGLTLGTHMVERETRLLQTVDSLVVLKMKQVEKKKDAEL